MKTLEEMGSLFHLSPEELSVFTQSLKEPHHTIAQLAKATKLARTQVYRHCEALKQYGLLKKVVANKRILWQPETTSTIKHLVETRLNRFKTLHQSLEATLNSFIEPSHPDTEVRFYQGSTGVSQLVWHILEAKTEIVGYTYRDLAQVTGEDFANDMYLEIIDRKLTMRDIFSDEYILSMGGWDQALKPSLPHPDWPRRITSRYVPTKTLPIPHQLDIYNDTVAFYNWHEGEVFGVEITNAKVADFQRKLFNLVWNVAKPL